MAPVQVRGRGPLRLRRVGAYHAITLVAPGVAEQARPGHFVALAVGGADAGMLLRRAFSMLPGAGARGLRRHRRDRLRGARAGAPAGWRRRHAARRGRRGRAAGAPVPAARAARQRGPGRRWLRQRAAVRARRAAAGAGLPGRLRARRRHRAAAVRRRSRPSGSPTLVAITTEDGSVGERGRVTDVLPELIERAGTDVVYACGPMGMLRAVARARAPRTACRSQVRRRGVDGLRRRGLHDLRAARRRATTASPGWCARASRARSSPATACAGPTSARCRGHLGAVPRCRRPG